MWSRVREFQEGKEGAVRLETVGYTLCCVVVTVLSWALEDGLPWKRVPSAVARQMLQSRIRTGMLLTTPLCVLQICALLMQNQSFSAFIWRHGHRPCSKNHKIIITCVQYAFAVHGRLCDYAERKAYRLITIKMGK